MKEKKSQIKILCFIGAVVLLFILNNYFGWSKYLGDTRNLAFLKETVKENMLMTLLIYIVLTIIGCVCLALPGATFALIAGMIFGPWIGTFAF